jgi:hypothetical protein
MRYSALCFLLAIGLAVSARAEDLRPNAPETEGASSSLFSPRRGSQALQFATEGTRVLRARCPSHRPCRHSSGVSQRRYLHRSGFGGSSSGSIGRHGRSPSGLRQAKRVESTRSIDSTFLSGFTEETRGGGDRLVPGAAPAGVASRPLGTPPTSAQHRASRFAVDVERPDGAVLVVSLAIPS